VKKILILIFALAAIALLIVTSCDPEPGDIPIQYVPEESPETILTEPETEQEVADPVSIYGAWIHVMSTEGEEEAPLTISEFALSSPRLDISGDDRISAVFYGTFIDGILISTGMYDFTVIEITATVEWQQWFPDDVTLRYNLESGLLRYTVSYAGRVVHHYFARE